MVRQAENLSSVMVEKENICEDSMKTVGKVASGIYVFGTSHLTVNFNFKS